MVLELFYFLGLVVILSTCLPLVPKGYWWLRVFDFPRAQFTAIGIFVLAGLAATGVSGAFGYVLMVALIAAISYQTYLVFPYLPIAPRQVMQAKQRIEGRHFSLMVANVLQDNRRADDLLDIVNKHNPDILIAMEVDDWWGEKLDELNSTYPFAIRCPLDNTYGMILYSKLELRDEECRFLVNEEIPSFFARVKIPSGDLIDLYTVHPSPPRPFQDTFERDAEILVIARQIRESGRPAVVAGDLNDVAWSITTRLFQRVSGLMDPRIGRGMFSTFHAKYPMLRWPLDHIFFAPCFKLYNILRLEYFGSDHFPVYVELQFKPENTREHTAPTPEPGDHAESAERIKEGVQSAERP